MEQFLSGISTACFAASGVFFLKFWVKTRDRFFIIFAVSFWVLATERFALVLVEPLNELRPLVYVMRLIAFVLILLAIVDKNRKSETL